MPAGSVQPAAGRAGQERFGHIGAVSQAKRFENVVEAAVVITGIRWVCIDNRNVSCSANMSR